jgi:LPS-assembly protein
MTVGQDGDGPPVTVEADYVEYLEDGARLAFYGMVSIVREGEVMTGDRAVWHEPTRSAEISGDVRILTRDFRATAERAAVNMDLMLARIFDGRAFFPERHYYVAGGVLERRGEEALYVEDGVFTTCDGPEPSWSLTAERLTVNRGGVAAGQGVTFRTRWLPVAYFPWFLAPVKTQRETGFLLPGFGSSTRDGFVLSLPFFWAASEDWDLTALPVYRSSRGLAVTLEGRYNLEAGQGVWLATSLSDRRPARFRYRAGGGPEEEVARRLWWLRAQNSWDLAGWNVNLDLDLVSDPAFLYTFRNDPDGFFYSRRLFMEHFGRTLNEELDPRRLSTLFAQKAGPDSYFRGTVSYTDDLSSRGNRGTLQAAPSLYYAVAARRLPEALASRLPGGGPRVSLDLQYDYYSRRAAEGQPDDETGHRLLVSPSFHWKGDAFGSVAALAKGGLDLGLYAPRGGRPSEGGGVEAHSPSYASLGAEASLELSTTLSRVYGRGAGGPGGGDGAPAAGEAYLHQVTPFVAFEFRHSPDQHELPYFDAFDRSLRRRTLRYGIRSTLTARSEAGAGAEGEGGGYAYREILKVGVFGSYEFASNLRWAEKGFARYYTTGYFDRGVGPFELEVEAALGPWLTARILSSLDARKGEFTGHDVTLMARDARGDSMAVIFDYEKPRPEYGPSGFTSISQLRGDLDFRLAGGWSAGGSVRFDFGEGRGLETILRLRYTSQCYAVSIVWEDSGDDRRAAFLIDLLGLGSFGNASSEPLAGGWLSPVEGAYY